MAPLAAVQKVTFGLPKRPRLNAPLTHWEPAKAAAPAQRVAITSHTAYPSPCPPKCTPPARAVGARTIERGMQRRSAREMVVAWGRRLRVRGMTLPGVSEALVP
jgi:hypothetical protein